MAFFEPLFAALNEAQVRYVVVGGVATVLHGHARLTAGVDLVIDLEPAACGRAIDILVQLGLQRRLPVEAADFADPALRRRWVEEKGMRVFSWVDPDNPLRAINLFAEYVVEFEQLWSNSEEIHLRPGFVRVASIRTSSSSNGAMADETGPVDHAHPRWKAGWEDQESNALESSMAATPLQRLEWLEEALELAAAAGSAPRGDRSQPEEAAALGARPPGCR